MPEVNDEIRVSEDERILFLKTARETDGELVEVRASYKPNSGKPPAHFHPNQEERFEVLSGLFRVNIGGEEADYRPGDTIQVPKGAVHWMFNSSDERGELLWQTRPALRTGDFFERIWTLQRKAASEDAEPSLMQLAGVLNEHRDEFRLASPPEPIQALLIRILALVGNTFGSRGGVR